MSVSQVEVMKGNVESRVQAYLQDLQKFRARWDQLKPGHDIIESGDHETLQRCVQNIRDRRAEFGELENTRKKLMCVTGLLYSHAEKRLWCLHSKRVCVCVPQGGLRTLYPEPS